MSEYLSEEEQIERLKKWLRSYGGSILMGILLALIAFFGWQYWQNRQAKIHVETMTQYQAIVEQSVKASEDKSSQSRFISNVQQLVKSQPESVFAFNALLLQAKVIADKGEWVGAEKALSQAVGLEIKDQGLKAIAWLRLARVQVAQNKLDVALTTLKNVTDPAFLPSADELRGDILIEKKDTAGAKAAYESAWASLVKRQQSRQLLKIKMNTLGLEPKEIVTPNPIRDPIREVPQSAANPIDTGAVS